MSNELSNVKIEPNGIVKCGNLNDALAYAAVLVKSGLVPAGLNTPEKVVLAVQYGASMGLSWVQSLRSISVIGNKPAVFGEAVVGICMPSGQIEVFEEWIEKDGGDDMVAICKLKRKGLDSVRVEKFSVADAKKANLWNSKEVWKSYPKDMLKHKARARAFKALFADMLCGLPIYEDLQGTAVEREVRVAPSAPDPLLATVVKDIQEPAKTLMPETVIDAEIVDVDTGEIQEPPIEELPPTPTGSVIEDVQIVMLTNKKTGDKFAKYGVKIDGVIHGTIKEAMGNLAQSLKGQRVNYMAEKDKTGKYSNLIELRPA